MKLNFISLRKKLIKALVQLAIIQIALAGSPDKLFSQTGQDFWDRGFMGQGRRILDYQFDRADRELSPGRWMEEARRGLISARAVWAEMAPEIFTDSQAMSAFDEWSEEELEKRFTRWLFERFFGAGIEAPASAVFAEAGTADKYLIYRTGADGNILYDPVTGDPLVIRPGDEGYDFTSDLLSWRSITDGAASRELQSYGTLVRENYPELLIYISSEREEEFAKKLYEGGEKSVRSLGHEFAAILARGERYFTAQRLGDVWSLRKKSEDQSADAIGTRLIEEARQACADGITSIEARIEAAKAEDADLALEGTRWLEEYREQFNRGLEAWENAEERFLIRLMEWEHSADKAFNDGLASWNAAFARFAEERKKWEEQARILFLEGEQFFAQASEILEKAIASARIEFATESSLRMGVASDRAGALASMYVISAAATDEARKNIDFWISRYKEISAGTVIPVEIGSLEVWTNMELIRHAETSNSLRRFILEELKTWIRLYRSYVERTEKGRQDLMKELYSISGSDSYEAELLRAEGELDYWMHRTAMAEAVTAYAAAMDAGRTTAAESAEAWEKALTAYNEAASLYEEAHYSSTKGEAAITAARNAMSKAAENMNAAEAKLETLRQNYQILSSVKSNAVSRILAEELAFLKQELASVQELLESNDKTSPWIIFITLARDMERQQYDNIISVVLQRLIAGDGETSYSLSSLAGKEHELPEKEKLLSFAKTLFNKNCITEEQMDLLIVLADENSASWAETQLGLRLATISLIAEKTGMSNWYSSVYEKSAKERPDIISPNMGIQLLSDWELSRLELLAARARLELRALDYLDGNDAGEDAAILAALYQGDDTRRLEDRVLLEQIMRLLDLLNMDKINLLSAGGLSNFMLEASLENMNLLPFFSGYSIITPQYSQEIYGIFLSDFIRNEEFCAGLYNTYTSLATITNAFISDNIERGFIQLARLWETIGIETNGSAFPGVENLASRMKELEEDFTAAALYPMFSILDEIFEPLPSWLDYSITQWKESLVLHSAFQTDETLALAKRQTNVLNSAFLLLKEDANSQSDYINPAIKYLENPLLEWNENYHISETVLNYDSLFGAMEILQSLHSREASIKGEISRISSLLEVSRKEEEPFEEAFNDAAASIIEAEKAVSLASAAYLAAAENFRLAGETYDKLYSTAEKAFKTLKETRRAFEIQDAVRLWAETAYLDSQKPSDELKYCEEKRKLAANVLEMLRSVNQTGNQSSAYKNAYDNYNESNYLYTSALEAFYKYEQLLAAERKITETAYKNYQEQLALLGSKFTLQDNYISPGDKALWSIRDMITVENGILVFARGNNNILSGCDKERTKKLNEYFSANINLKNEAFQVSSFELALRNLAEKFNNLSLEQYLDLGLARDYLIKQILDNNPGLGGTNGWLKKADALREGNLSNMVIGSNGKQKVREKAGAFEAEVAYMQLQAWDSLDAETKKYLEFYTILTLLGGGGKNADNFSRVSEYWEYRLAMDYGISNHITVYKKTTAPILGLLFVNDFKKITLTLTAIYGSLEELDCYINIGCHGLLKTIGILDEKYNIYKKSSELLAIKENGKSGTIRWSDIEATLSSITGLSADLNRLQGIWNSLSSATMAGIKDISGALRLLTEICMNRKNESYNTLVQVWNRNESERKTSEAAYRKLYDEYLAGNAKLSDLRAKAVLSFGESIPSKHKHITDIGSSLLNTFGNFSKNGLDGTKEQSALVGEFVQLINKAWEEKYSAELAIRENEWDSQRRDIREKLYRWQELAAVILEQGRAAWKEADQMLNEARNVWAKTFHEESGRIRDQWTAAYLEGLRDKEAWAAAALEAASGASSAAVLALVGSGAEAGARAMDTRDPLGNLNLPDIAESENLIFDFLAQTGTDYLAAAFGSIKVSRESLGTVVRTGIGGGGAWNYGSVMAEASALAKSVRNAFAERESQKLSYLVMNTAREAYKMLEDNLRLANENFNNKMDENFIIDGQWQRSGTGYAKKVIVHSTFFNAVITENTSIDGYRYFLLPQMQLSGYLYDDLPQNMNSFQADALAESVNLEIEELFKKIFGSDEADGEFQMHIGAEPVFKASGDMNIEDGRGGVFENFGEGELGRLLTEFYFWMAKEQTGIAMMNMAPWDKPLWDSRESWFEAPTLRSAVDIVIQTGVAIAGAVGSIYSGGGSLIAAAAIIAAINSADDLVFAALDIAGGYKSWSEAGVTFGKAVAVNVASAAASTAFSGIKGSTSVFLNNGGVSGIFKGGVGGALWKGFSAGAQTITSGTITSAVNSITYNDKNGFDFSMDSFKEGLKQTGINALSLSVGTATSGLMNTTLEGFLGNIFNDGNKFATLTGGLASQGINYAFGNDFTLNVFNIGAITGLFTDKEINAGILELRLGRDGVNMQFGAGGVDVSIGTLVSAVKGIEAYMINLELLLSKEEATGEFAKELRALYSKEGAAREEYNNVLAGKTKYVKWDNDYSESKYDETTGVKTVYLGNDAFNSGSTMGLAVVFAHEAYRDGITGSKEEQGLEFNSAIMGHIRMAASVYNTYGPEALGSWMTMELMLYNEFLKTGNQDALQAVINSYDDTGEFWKLVKNENNLWGWIDDNSADFDISDLLNDPEFEKHLSYVKSALIEAVLESGFNGKQFGTIRSDKMTEKLAFILGNAVVPYIFPAGKNYNGLQMITPYEMEIDSIRNALVMDTLDKITYNALHTSIVFDKNMRPVSLHNIDTANNIAGTLPGQHSGLIGNIPYMSAAGCNFMNIISVPQILSKKTLTEHQVMEIWNTAVKTGIIDMNGLVKNREALSNLALQRLGINNFGITYGNIASSIANSVLVGFRLEIPYGNNSQHFVLVGTDNLLVYNPGYTYTDDQSKWRARLGIYAYGK